MSFSFFARERAVLIIIVTGKDAAASHNYV